jgi:hypothetical protein
MNEIVIKFRGDLATTSMAIAEGTKTQHKNVLALIRAHRADIEQFGQVAFETRLNQQGSGTEVAMLNEQQSALTIAFMRNSEVVRAFKVALVKEFYRMRDTLAAPVADTLAILPPEQRALIAVMVENAAIKAEQATQANAIKRIEAKQSAFENGHSFFTAMAFCALRGVKLMMPDMQRLGRMAAAHSKANGIAIDKVRDTRFGMVNAYHETALDAAFAEMHGGM